jgi:hypothetical protein
MADDAAVALPRMLAPVVPVWATEDMGVRHGVFDVCGIVAAADGGAAVAAVVGVVVVASKFVVPFVVRAIAVRRVCCSHGFAVKFLFVC